MPHHNEAARDLAYQVWAFVAGRQLKEVARIMERDHGEIIPLRTLTDWSSRYGWSERVATDLAAIAPDIQTQTIGEIILGALEGARMVRKSVREDVPAEERPSRDQILAGLGLMDRGGFSHLGKIAARSVERPSALPASVDLQALSVDEALALQSEMLEQLTATAQRATSQSR